MFPANICWSWRRLQRNNFTSSKTFGRHLGRRKIVTLKTSWRRLEGMSWRRLEDMSWRCLEDMSWRHVLKTSWRHVLKTSWRHVLKTCLEDVLKTCLEDVLKTLWRKAKYLLGISVSNKSKCVSNKSIFYKSISDNSKANPKCIN